MLFVFFTIITKMIICRLNHLEIMFYFCFLFLSCSGLGVFFKKAKSIYQSYQIFSTEILDQTLSEKERRKKNF